MTRLIASIALVATGALLAVGWQYASGRTKAADPDASHADKNAARSIESFEGTGYVEPRSELRRLAFRVGGVVASCDRGAGDTVRKGDVLARLDDSTLKVAAEASRRKLDLARAKLCDLKAGEHPHLIRQCERSVERLAEHARHSLQEAARLEKLATSGSTSENERNESSTKATQSALALREKQEELMYLKGKVRPEQLTVAEAEVRLAEAEAAAAAERVHDARLEAPFDGVVLKYLKREGEGVSPLTPPEPAVLFGDLSRLRVRAEIDERYANLLAVGQRAEVYGRNVGVGPHAGRLVEVERVMGDKTLFTRSASERKDLHVIQVVVEMGRDFVAPAGLQVDVRVLRK